MVYAPRHRLTLMFPIFPWYSGFWTIVRTTYQRKNDGNAARAAPTRMKRATSTMAMRRSHECLRFGGLVSLRLGSVDVDGALSATHVIEQMAHPIHPRCAGAFTRRKS